MAFSQFFFFFLECCKYNSEFIAAVRPCFVYTHRVPLETEVQPDHQVLTVRQESVETLVWVELRERRD